MGLTMFKTLFATLFMALFIACQFEETGDPSGSLISQHKETTESFSVTLPSSGYFNAGDEIVFKFKHPYPLTVTGNPRVELDIGGTIAYASYVSKSDSRTLLFKYYVQSGHNDSDGIELTSTSIDLNGGNLQYTSGGITSAATLTISSQSLSGVIVDTTAPSISTVTPPIDDTYIFGKTSAYFVSFDENVYVIGSPRIPLTIDGATKYASYSGGSGTSTLRFTYTTEATDEDMDGITINTPIDLNSGTIADKSGNSSALAYATQNLPFVYINGNSPYVTSFVPPSDGTYTTGDTLEISLVFSESVNVVGTPRIGIEIGSTTYYATYQSGTGSKTLLFSYTLTSANTDTDGIDVDNIIDLNGGTIRDTSPSNAILEVDAYHTPNILVDPGTPSVSSITLPSVPGDGYFTSAETINVTLTFSEIVNVTGTPQVGLTFDTPGTTVYADYFGGGGTTDLVFQYTVVDTVDEDHTGFNFVSPINLNGGSIIGATSGMGINTNYSSIALATDTSLMKVDAIDGSITALTPPADGTYPANSNLDFVITFSEIVDVTGGTPRLQLDIGGATRYAEYVSGTGTTDLTFREVVVTNDVDADGIGLVSTSIDLNGASILDQGGNAPDLDFSAYSPTLTSVLVDATVPSITNVSITGNTYIIGETIDVNITFDENVFVASGTPTIGAAFQTQAGTPSFNYSSGNGSSVLIFQYTVVSGDNDTDGIDLSSAITLSGATIRDGANNDADLNLTSTNFPTVFIDGIGPTIAITSPTTGTYINIASDSAAYAISGTCDDAAATLDVQIDGASAAGQTGMACNGTNFSGTFNSTGIAEGAFTLTVVATELSGNSTTSTGISITKDTVAPNITGVTIPPTTYVESDTITTTVLWNENVTIATSTPQISATFNSMAGSPVFVYQTGSGSSSTTFTYTVLAGDSDPNGIDLAASVNLNSSTIRDDAGNDATLTLSTTNFPSVLISGAGPTVVITSPTNGSYINSSTDSVTFAITGTCDDATATYDIQVGGTSAANQAGVTCDGANLSGTFDTTGIAEGTFSLTIYATDLLLNDSTSSAVTITKDTVAPTISSVTAPASADYTNTQDLDFTATFSENVTITGTRIPLTFDSGGVFADYNSGSGGTSIVYRYTVTGTDSDTNGINITSSIQLNGGSIVDDAGNNATLTFSAPTTSGITVNASAPAFDFYDNTMALITTLDFGDPTGNTTHVVTIENTGSASTSANFLVTVPGGTPQITVDVVDDNCSGNIIAVNGTCTIIVTWKEQGSAGAKSKIITVDDTGYGINPGYDLNVTGIK